MHETTRETRLRVHQQLNYERQRNAQLQGTVNSLRDNAKMARKRIRDLETERYNYAMEVERLKGFLADAVEQNERMRENLKNI